VRIAVSATGPSLDAEVDPRFGRCRYFVIADPESLEFEALENTSQAASGGAGIASAQVVAGKDVKAVLTGNCGPNAYQTLEAAGIQVITGVSGTVRDAIEGYKAGRFEAASGPTVAAHHGMSGPAQVPAGSGAGGGGGCGGGRGAGGEGQGSGSIGRDIEALQAQTMAMGQQLSDIVRRLDSIDKREGR